MSSLYSGLALFCLYEAGVPEFDTRLHPSYSVNCTLNTGKILGLELGRIHQAQKGGGGWLGPSLSSVLAGAQVGAGDRGQPLHMTIYLTSRANIPNFTS